MAKIEIYSATYCPYCDRAKALLKQKGLTYTEYVIDQDSDKRAEMEQRSKRRTVPQIFINGHAIGGSDDLYALHRSGELDTLISKE